MIVKYIFLIAFVCGTVWAQVNTIPETNITLPPELEGKFDKKVIEEAQNKSLEAFKKKCEDNGGADAFNSVKDAYQNFAKCLEGFVDTATLQREIEEAKPKGAVDEVFKKYCNKKPEFTTCFRNLTDTSKKCFTGQELNSINVVNNASEQLAEFICFKEGDRIALFIAEGGQECIQEKSSALEKCMNETFASNVSANVDEISNQISSLTFDENQCKKLSDLQVCVVGALEQCTKPTTANIAESLFKFIRKSTPCKKYDEPIQKRPNGASGYTITWATLLVSALATLIAK